MLCSCLLAVLPQGALIPDQPALVEVKHGRARVVAEGGTLQLTSLDPASVSRGAAHLEVTAGSVVFVTWRGLATLRFEGPAAFEWGGESAAGVLNWRAIDVASLEAEVRRGVAKLELPMGWQADFKTGAYHIESLADGGTRIVHTAGKDLRLRWMGERGAARPPAFLRAGQSARLASPPQLASPPDLTAAAPAWSRYEWPWGVHGIPGRPDLGAGAGSDWTVEAWPFGPSSEDLGDVWPVVEWPWQADELRALETASKPAQAEPATLEPTEPVEPLQPPTAAPVAEELSSAASAAVEPGPSTSYSPAEPVRELAVEEALEPAPQAEPVGESFETTIQPEPVVAEPESAPEAEPEPVPEPEAILADPEPVVPPQPAEPEVMQTGPLRHRPHAELRFEEQPDGQWTVSLPASAAGPAQILGQRFDTWILPGGTIQVDANGRLIYHLGQVKMRPSAR